jgi:methyl-accepting chemotaxis protein
MKIQLKKRKNGFKIKMTNTNKKLIDELKKYNTELDKHVSGVDVNLMSRVSKNSSPSEQNEEFNHLFSQNLLDLRTEVSLLRKNLSVDIEGMVMKVVNNQQNLFSEKMNNLFLQTTMDMKTFLNDMVVNFGDEITQIKRSYNEMSIQNSNLISQVSNLSDEVLVLREEIHAQKHTQNQLEISRKLDNIENTIQLSTTLINENNQSLTSHFSNVNKSLLNLSKLSPPQLTQSSSNKINTTVNKKTNIFSNNLQTPTKMAVKRKLFEPNLEISEPLVEVVQSDYKLGLGPLSQIPNKILDIDSRLSKLHNLK